MTVEVVAVLIHLKSIHLVLGLRLGLDGGVVLGLDTDDVHVRVRGEVGKE